VVRPNVAIRGREGDEAAARRARGAEATDSRRRLDTMGSHGWALLARPVARLTGYRAIQPALAQAHVVQMINH
jgi:hypothetical protein